MVSGLFVLLYLGLSLAATVELLLHLLGPLGRPPAWLCYLGLTALAVVNWLPHLPSGRNLRHAWPFWIFGTFIAFVLAVFLVEMKTFREPGESVNRMALAVWLVAYLGLLPSFLAQLRWLGAGGKHGTAALALAIFVPKCCDIGAYFTGRLIGRHRMTPVLSPKKTWEGAAGGLVLAAVDSGCSGSVWAGTTVARAPGRGNRLRCNRGPRRHVGRPGRIPGETGLSPEGCLAGGARFWRRAGCGGRGAVCCPGGVSLVDDDSMSINTTITMTLDSRDEAVLLFGTRDQHLRLIRDALACLIIARGDTLQIEGPQEAVGQAERVFQQLRQMLRQQGKLTPEEVRTVLSVVQRGGDLEGPQNLTIVEGGRHVRPRTDGQARYVQAMRDNDLVMCIGPAGTGKTYLAVGMAVTLLRQGLVKRIVLVRPAVEAGERLGFLPGDIVAKINPYLRPLFDSLNDMMEPDQVKRYMENDIIEIVPLAYMRGRTLNMAVIILDEGQNSTVPQMKMFLTRMGNGSKIIVTGDVTQVDLPRQTRNGLLDAIHRLRDLERIGIVFLTDADIVRHPLVQRIVKAYEDDKPRKKRSE